MVHARGRFGAPRRAGVLECVGSSLSVLSSRLASTVPLYPAGSEGDRDETRTSLQRLMAKLLPPSAGSLPVPPPLDLPMPYPTNQS